MRISLKLSSVAILFAVLVLVAASFANVPPDSTRYDDAGEGSYGLTVDLGADADTVIWFGFKAWTGSVIRMNVDVIVQPLTIANRKIVDGPPWAASWTIANPRAGESLYTWGPDTLTTTNARQEYCCNGLIGYRITAIDTTGYVKVYATGGRP